MKKNTKTKTRVEILKENLISEIYYIADGYYIGGKGCMMQESILPLIEELIEAAKNETKTSP